MTGLKLPALILLTLASQGAREVPSTADQRKAERFIRNLFKADYAVDHPNIRRALAKKLLQQAQSTDEDPAARFVLLREAADLAVRAGDADSAVRASQQTEKDFAVPEFSARLDVVVRLAKASLAPDQFRLLASSGLALAQDGLKAGRADVAEAAGRVASQAGTRLRDIPLITRGDAIAKNAAGLKKAIERVKGAKEKLAASPDDPESNLIAGEYACFFQEAWEEGLPLLVKGSDSILRDLAQRDLAKPVPPELRLALADDWWKLAEDKEPHREALRKRASRWYQEAWPGLSPEAREKIRDRVAKSVAAPVPSSPPEKGKPPVYWSSRPEWVSVDTQFAYGGSRSVRMVPTAAGPGWSSLMQGPFPAIPGKTYVLTCRVMPEKTEGKYGVMIRWFKQGVHQSQAGVGGPLDQPFWHPVVNRQTCPADCDSLDIGVFFSGTLGHAYFDEFSLKVDGEAAEILRNGSFED